KIKRIISRKSKKRKRERVKEERRKMVTKGTTNANKIVGMYTDPAGRNIMIDRNCHKSLTHLMMMSDVTTIYFRPNRNDYGILGG
ncbi:hypothetical protein GLP06_23230, partial [Escherichia coli]|nr:hypothetical protein [Escherichia coli]